MDFKFQGKDFAEKLRKKAGGAFIDFPRFAYAHYVHVYKFQISKFKSSVFVAQSHNI